MGRGCNWVFPLAEAPQLYSSGRGLFPACGKDSIEGTAQGFMKRSGGGALRVPYLCELHRVSLHIQQKLVQGKRFVPQTSAELCSVPGVGIGRAFPISQVCPNGAGEGGTS